MPVSVMDPFITYRFIYPHIKCCMEEQVTQSHKMLVP